MLTMSCLIACRAFVCWLLQWLAVLHYTSVSTVDCCGSVRTKPLVLRRPVDGLHAGLQGVSSFEVISNPSTVNHAYICPDIESATIGPRTVGYSTDMQCSSSADTRVHASLEIGGISLETINQVAPTNHAYLCIHLADRTIRPQMVPLSSDVVTGVPAACISDEMDCECVVPGNLLEELSLVAPSSAVPSSAVLDVPLCANLRHMEISGGNLDGRFPVYETVCDTPPHVIAASLSSSTRSFLPLPSTINSKPSHSTNSEDDFSYVDLGDCNLECRGCGCFFWLGEMLKGHPYEGQPEYHGCYGGGKIYNPPGRDPPVFIQHLLDNPHFMDHIRAYNQMFAMTSFGAKVDDSINSGVGPYVFKVSGQAYHWIGSLCPSDAPRFLQMYIYDTKDEVDNRMRHFGGQDNGSLSAEIVHGLMEVLDTYNGLVRLFRTARDRCDNGDIPGFKIRLYNKGGTRGYELPSSDCLGGIVFEDGPRVVHILMSLLNSGVDPHKGLVNYTNRTCLCSFRSYLCLVNLDSIQNCF